VTVEEVGPDRVRVTGARGRERPETLKATVCIDGGVLGEAEISYAGPNAGARARLAAEIVRTRTARRSPGLRFRIDPIGVVSALGDSDGAVLARTTVDAEDVRVRVAAQSPDAASVERLLDEVEALYCAGPAGGAGVRRRMTPRLASASCLVERALVVPTVTLIGGSP
jgi:hypothetical protein